MGLEKSIEEDQGDGHAGSLKSQIFWYKWGAGVLAVFAIVMFGIGFYLHFGEGLAPNEIGDFWSGGVGPLLSFAALIILYVAFLGQRQQLQLQQEELKATRKELAGQREQLELQNQQTEQRNFENTFFQLIRLHNDIVNAIDYEKRRITEFKKNASFRYVQIKGRDCFKLFYKDLEDAYNNRETELSVDVATVMEESSEEMSERDEQSPDKDYVPEWDIDREKQRVLHAYKQFWEDNRADLEHYFQSLLQVLNHAVKGKGEDVDTYVGIVLAQLSTYERLLLAYHYLSGYAPPEMKRHVADHGILNPIPSDALLSEAHTHAIKDELSEQASERT